MKRAIGILLIGAALAVAEGKFEVEELTPCEVEELAAALKAAEAATEKLEATQQKVKAAHGGDSTTTHRWVPGITAMANCAVIDVELKGKYALKTTKITGNCGGGGFAYTLPASGVTNATPLR